MKGFIEVMTANKVMAMIRKDAIIAIHQRGVNNEDHVNIEVQGCTHAIPLDKTYAEFKAWLETEMEK